MYSCQMETVILHNTNIIQYNHVLLMWQQLVGVMVSYPETFGHIVYVCIKQTWPIPSDFISMHDFISFLT